jgi:arylsulfatase A-like enzyme
VQYGLTFCLLIAFLSSACGGGEQSPVDEGEPTTESREIVPTQRLVIVTIDTLRADLLPLYGYPRPTAPFLSSLSQSATLFENAFTASSHTAPAHASLFTGAFPYEHRLLRNGDVLQDAIPTLASVLEGYDFETAAFVSVNFLDGLRRGFGTFDGPEFHGPLPPYHRPGGATLEPALRWIRSRDPGQRLFLWLHLYDPHEWETPDDAYTAPRAQLGLESPIDESHLESELLSLGMRREAFEREGLDWLDGIAEYEARIRYVDEQLRGLVRGFEEAGLQDGTLWIVTADHGEGLGNHSYLGHGRFLYQEQLRVPLLFYRPSAPFGPRRVARLGRLIDLLPTSLELLGVAAPPDMEHGQARSFRRLLDERGAAYPIEFSLAQRRPADAVRDQAGWSPGELLSLGDLEHKVIFASTVSAQAFRLRDDPHELEDLADDGHADFLPLIEALRETHRRVLQAEVEAGPPQIDERYRETLRALGYLE